MPLQEAFALAERLHNRPYWHLMAIVNNEAPVSYPQNAYSKPGFVVRAYCCGVIFPFEKTPSDEDLDYLETYGM